MALFALLLLVCLFPHSTTNDLCQCGISGEINNLCCNLFGKCCEVVSEKPNSKARKLSLSSIKSLELKNESVDKTTKIPKAKPATKSKNIPKVNFLSRSYGQSFQSNNFPIWFTKTYPTNVISAHADNIFTDITTDAAFTMSMSTEETGHNPIVISLSRPLPQSSVLLNTSALFSIMKARATK